MPDDLVVGGGGSIAVATTGMFSHAQRLEALELELHACARRLLAIDRIVRYSNLTGADAPLSAVRAEQAIDAATIGLDAAADRSGQLAAMLRLGADLYGATEATLADMRQGFAAQFGAGLGFLASSVGLLLLPGLVSALSGAGAGFALIRAVNPSAGRLITSEAAQWLDDHKGVLSDPRLVELVRLSVMSADDFGGGMLRLPPSVIRLVGDEGLGVVGLDTAAATVVAAGGAIGVLRETRVMTPVSTGSAAAPASGYADRASRIPAGSAQVRVDRYVRDGAPDRFEVYIGGTIDFAPTATVEPFDLTSNLAGIAGGDAGSYRAVEQALAAAGVEADSEMVVTGYSQGGLIGSMLAASGDYEVTGLYTLGAPAGQVPVPDSVPWVAVEHIDDLVPAVGGTWASADPVLVRREAIGEGAPTSDLLFPAHQLSNYRETAALIDAADEQRLVDSNARFGQSGRAVDRVESTWYRSIRVPDGER